MIQAEEKCVYEDTGNTLWVHITTDEITTLCGKNITEEYLKTFRNTDYATEDTWTCSNCWNK